MKDTNRTLEPEELVLIGRYRQAVRDFGPEAGERILAEALAAITRQDARPTRAARLGLRVIAGGAPAKPQTADPA